MEEGQKPCRNCEGWRRSAALPSPGDLRTPAPPPSKRPRLPTDSTPRTRRTPHFTREQRRVRAQAKRAPEQSTVCWAAVPTAGRRQSFQSLNPTMPPQSS